MANCSLYRRICTRALIFALLGFSHTMPCTVEGSERYPEPAAICHSLYASGKGETGCRKTMAFGFQCRDLSKCHEEGMDCSNEDVALRAGNSCHGFPYYNGGYPLSAHFWDSEVETMECTVDATMSSQSDYCPTWLTIEDSRDEWEAGHCKCLRTIEDVDAGRTYCASWHCEQIEVDKCIGNSEMVNRGDKSWSRNWKWSHNYNKRSSWSWRGGYGLDSTGWLEKEFGEYAPNKFGDWDYFPYQCMCHDDDNGYHICGPEVETEVSDCECTLAERGICVQWHCEEYDDAGYSERELEDYNATVEDINADGVFAVSRWKGRIDSESEFEFSRCECNVYSTNGRFCMAWECYEKGMAYFFPNNFWFLLHVPVLNFAATYFVYMIYVDVKLDGELDLVGLCIGGCLALVWIAAWQILFIWIGGVGEMLIASIFTVLVMAALSCFTLLKNRGAKIHTRRSASVSTLNNADADSESVDSVGSVNSCRDDERPQRMCPNSNRQMMMMQPQQQTMLPVMQQQQMVMPPQQQMMMQPNQAPCMATAMAMPQTMQQQMVMPPQQQMMMMQPGQAPCMATAMAMPQTMQQQQMMQPGPAPVMATAMAMPMGPPSQLGAPTAYQQAAARGTRG